MANLSKNKQNISTHSNYLNPLLRFHKEFSNVMNDFYDMLEPAHTLNQLENIRLSPSMDIVEDEKCFKVEVEMPGMGEEDIKVSVNNNMLTIEGEKSTSRKDEKKNYLSREISYGRYERTISLPQNANLDKIDATFKKGMLWVTIPKKNTLTKTSKKIAVKKVEH